jgi:hypothetical protein
LSLFGLVVGGRSSLLGRRREHSPTDGPNNKDKGLINEHPVQKSKTQKVLNDRRDIVNGIQESAGHVSIQSRVALFVSPLKSIHNFGNLAVLELVHVIIQTGETKDHPKPRENVYNQVDTNCPINTRFSGKVGIANKNTPDEGSDIGANNQEREKLVVHFKGHNVASMQKNLAQRPQGKSIYSELAVPVQQIFYVDLISHFKLDKKNNFAIFKNAKKMECLT